MSSWQNVCWPIQNISNIQNIQYEYMNLGYANPVKKVHAGVCSAFGNFYVQLQCKHISDDFCLPLQYKSFQNSLQSNNPTKWVANPSGKHWARATEIKDLFLTTSKSNGAILDELEYLHVYIFMSHMFITLMSISSVLPNSSIVFTLGQNLQESTVGYSAASVIWYLVAEKTKFL